jgi:hypothetical protein
VSGSEFVIEIRKKKIAGIIRATAANKFGGKDVKLID